MFLKASLISLSLSILGSAQAQVSDTRSSKIQCELDQDETLVIGCTHKCGRFNNWAINRYAKKLGYKVRTVNLNNKNSSIDYTQVDGILIPGGVDIDPKYYIDKVTPEMRSHIEKLKHLANLTENGELRDAHEFDLLTKYFSNKKSTTQPLLGICRGMQAISVSQGLPLYLDIKTELGIKNRRYTLDTIRVTHPNSLLKEIMGRDKFRGVELHHQGINMSYYNQHKKSWPHLQVTSLSNKSLVAESVEFTDRPVLGVQFHPEYTFGKVRRSVFNWLLKRACFNKKSQRVLAAQTSK